MICGDCGLDKHDRCHHNECPMPLQLAEERIERLEAFVSLCRDGFFVEDKTLMNAADRILKE